MLDEYTHCTLVISPHHENNIGKGKESLCLFKPLRRMVGVDVELHALLRLPLHLHIWTNITLVNKSPSAQGQETEWVLKRL